MTAFCGFNVDLNRREAGGVEIVPPRNMEWNVHMLLLTEMLVLRLYSLNSSGPSIFVKVGTAHLSFSVYLFIAPTCIMMDWRLQKSKAT